MAVYDPALHPAVLIDYFTQALEDLEEAERSYTKGAGVKFTKRPTRPPTLAGFAVQAGVGTKTVRKWIDIHPEFAEAYDVATTAWEHLLLEQGLTGAYDSRLTQFLLKNLRGHLGEYRDKVDHEHRGGVKVVLDEQDLEVFKSVPEDGSPETGD
jgi:hypothetical protein